jgi:hypothetical protein
MSALKLNSMGIPIGELFDTVVLNKPYDYSSPVPSPESFTQSSFRPAFFSPIAKRKPILRRRPGVPIIPESLLGKRRFGEAFEESHYDDERFNQHIDTDFFAKNIGHNIYVPKPDYELEEGEIYEPDILA